VERSEGEGEGEGERSASEKETADLAIAGSEAGLLRFFSTLVVDSSLNICLKHGMLKLRCGLDRL
jgi:hypothetical protein